MRNQSAAITAQAARRFAGYCAATGPHLLRDAYRPSAQQLFFGHDPPLIGGVTTLTGARDKFHLAAIAQNLKTLATGWREGRPCGLSSAAGGRNVAPRLGRTIGAVSPEQC
jgi:hypothetical protein